MSAPNTHLCRLLNIPRELRDEIYGYYLMEDEGYHHHPETNTLRCFDCKPIDLALMHCCKQIAQEMKGMPLQLKTINFKPYHAHDLEESHDKSDAWARWSKAGRFDFLLERLHSLQEELFVIAASTHGKLIQQRSKSAPN
jgi:hypothetical protein